jgi:hypothetical protein
MCGLFFSVMDMDKYPVVEDKHSLSFKFVSEGPKGKVEKKIVYTKLSNPDIYGLGFGDKILPGADIDDLNITNNGDMKKILATVASTLLVFTDWFPCASIFAEGSTKARNRLYRMAISNNYDLIRADFEIFGRINKKWQRFERNKEYEAFLARRKFINLSL